MGGKDVNPDIFKAAKHTEEVYQDAEEVCDIRSKAGQIDVQIECVRLPENEDRTWEPLPQVHEDIPGLLREFLNSPGNLKLKESAPRQNLYLFSFTARKTPMGTVALSRSVLKKPVHIPNCLRNMRRAAGWPWRIHTGALRG